MILYRKTGRTDLNSGNLHHLQRDILVKLSRSSPLRFSELQPKSIANNVFSYHIKKLVELGYIESGSDGYRPTRKALKALHFADESRNKLVHPLTLTMIYVKNDEGKVLLMERTNNPFRGWYGIPSGPVHSGESLVCAAARELFEKTGIIASLDDLSPDGVIDFQYINKDSGDLFVHGIGFVYRYTYSDPTLEGASNSYGTLHWSTLTNPRVLPEVYEARKLFENPVNEIISCMFDEPTLGGLVK